MRREVDINDGDFTLAEVWRDDVSRKEKCYQDGKKAENKVFLDCTCLVDNVMYIVDQFKET